MVSPFDPPVHAVREAVERALREDLTPLGDLTSALLPTSARTSASLIARSGGVLAGTSCVNEVFHQIDDEIAVDWHGHDGDRVDPGQVLGRVTGQLAPILSAERTALNFVCHLSGIATLTSEYVAAAEAGGSAKVWDTRKTTPGLRALQKAAVRAGGGHNHRGNLSEWLMFKDNHLTAVGIGEAVAKARLRWPGRTIEVEADRIDQVEEAVEAGVDLILLDNMSVAMVGDAVVLVRSLTGVDRPLIEASGGITLDTIGSYSGAGVDLISVSRITQSAPALDIGLDHHC